MTETRKNLRRIVIPVEPFGIIGPAAAIALMKANGFTFETETCPIVLTDPKSVTPSPAGVVYEQWDEEPDVVADLVAAAARARPQTLAERFPRKRIHLTGPGGKKVWTVRLDPATKTAVIIESTHHSDIWRGRVLLLSTVIVGASPAYHRAGIDGGTGKWITAAHTITAIEDAD